MQRQNFIRPAFIAIAILMIPLVGNFTVEGWNWDFLDFCVMFLLLYVAGLIYEFLASKTTNFMHRAVIGGFVILGTLAAWSELAVDPFSQALRMLFA